MTGQDITLGTYKAVPTQVKEKKSPFIHRHITQTHLPISLQNQRNQIQKKLKNTMKVEASFKP
jgi:hypothetical protein